MAQVLAVFLFKPAAATLKDRCEPCQMRQVLEVVSGSRGVSPEALAEAVHRNNEVFFKKNCRALRINVDANWTN